MYAFIYVYIYIYIYVETQLCLLKIGVHVQTTHTHTQSSPNDPGMAWPATFGGQLFPCMIFRDGSSNWMLHGRSASSSRAYSDECHEPNELH